MKKDHLSKGIVSLSMALSWAMVYLVISFGLAYTGVAPKLVRGLHGVGAVVFLALLWRGVRNFWLAFRPEKLQSRPRAAAR